MPIKEWQDQRRRRVSSPASVEIGLTKLRLKSFEDDIFTIRFVQAYTSARYSDLVYKTMKMKYEDGKWLIVKEYYDD